MGTILKDDIKIWYKYEDRHENLISLLPSSELIHLCEAVNAKSRLTTPADSLALKIKRAAEDEYFITLDTDYFRNECGNSFRKLINDFGIEQTNPIKGETSAYFPLFLFCLYQL
jgi:hypothetical protein